MKKLLVILTLLLVLVGVRGQSGSALNTGLVSYWAFEETSGNAIDQPGTNDGTVDATVTQHSSGKIGYCVLFDGTNTSRITLPSNSGTIVGTQSITVSAWIYINTLPASYAAIWGGTDDAFSCGIDNAGHLKVTRVNYSDAPVSSATLSTGQWYFVTFRFNSSATTNNLRYGVGKTFENVTYNVDFGATAGSTIIGQRYLNVDKLQGKVDEMGLWNTVISDALVDTLYDGVDGAGAEGYAYPWSTYTAGEQNYFLGKTVTLLDGKYRSTVLNGKQRAELRAVRNTPITQGDTIQYYLYEDFSTWTNTDVATEAALQNKWDYWGYFETGGQCQIVNDGVSHGNAWQVSINANEWQGMGLMIMIDTALQDCWVSYDMKLDPNFTTSSNIPPAHKSGMGLFSGNNSDPENTVDDTSTTGYYSVGATLHPVGGTAGRQYGYLYAQGRNDGSEWVDGWGVADSGYYAADRGVWHHFDVHLNVGTPGKAPGHYDGFGEIYRDGVMVSRYSGVKFRSLSQQSGEYAYGLIEAVFMEFFFGGPHTSSFASPITQWCRFDNIVVYSYLSDAVNYRTTFAERGSTTPDVVKAGSYARKGILKNASYTAASDTIFDVGDDKGYIWNPPHDNDSITITVVRPSGTINYSFLIEEWGYGPDMANQDYYVTVYEGTGAGKVIKHKFGRSNRYGLPAYEDPSGTYTNNTSSMTFVFHTGWSGQACKGIAIRYWQP